MPATEPGTPIALYPTRLAFSITLPCASRYIWAVAAAGAFSALIEKVSAAPARANQHEAAATKIARLGMHHRQREASGDCGVDGVSAGLHDLEPSPRRQLMNARHHGAWRVHWMG